MYEIFMIKIFFFVSGAWNPCGGPSTGRTWSKAPRVNRTGVSPPTWTLSKLTWDTDVRKHKTCWGPMRCCSPSPTFQGGKSTNFYIHIKYTLYNILFIYLFKNIVRLSQMLWTTQNYKCHIMNFSCDSVSESEKLYNFQVINHHNFF